MVSSNPIVKIINIVVGIMEFLTGTRRAGTLSEEQDCLVVDTSTKVFWVFLKSEDVTKISKSRVSAIKVSTEKSWIIFRSTVVTIFASGVSDEVAYEVKAPYSEIKQKAELWLK
jgi:hypothetical protein